MQKVLYIKRDGVTIEDSIVKINDEFTGKEYTRSVLGAANFLYFVIKENLTAATRTDSFRLVMASRDCVGSEMLDRRMIETIRDCVGVSNNARAYIAAEIDSLLKM